jgi:flagellar basal body-associated protein FliL
MKKTILNVIIFLTLTIIIFVLCGIPYYFFGKELSKQQTTQFYKDFKIWYNEINPKPYVLYQFKADDKTWIYYKSKGIIIKEVK